VKGAPGWTVTGVGEDELSKVRDPHCLELTNYLKENAVAKETSGKGEQSYDDGAGHFHPLYGGAIHNCIAHGDLQAMKGLLGKAEAYLNEHGDISAAVESLRLEIAKLEHK
jgi:hypothetical protein